MGNSYILYENMKNHPIYTIYINLQCGTIDYYKGYGRNQMRKIANMFYSIFFVAAIIFLIYCFTEFREDIPTMICATIVMLIATFLFIDVLVSIYQAEKKELLEKAQERQDEATKEIKKTMEEILKYEKAIYVVNKRELVEMKKDQLSEQINDQQSDTAKFKVL